MSHAPQGDFVPVEHDTFLDIVTNVVGILVILVMLVGLQARDVPPAAASVRGASQSPGAAANVTALEQELVHLHGAAQQLAGTVQQREVERQYMATLRADAERQLAEYRNSLDGQAREKFDLQQRLTATNARIDELDRQRVQAAAADGPVVAVTNYPTPLGRSVFGREVHFQLRGGRLAHLPIEELVDDAKDQAKEKLWKLDGLPEDTEMVGPCEGFRMRYTLEKADLPSTDRATGQRGYVVRVRWQLVPIKSELGEPVEAALAPGSQLNQILSTMDPAQTTVTLWTYPDSFAAYRRIKAELYRRGFATAGRPLPDGILIGGSPSGTRSSAE